MNFFTSNSRAKAPFALAVGSALALLFTFDLLLGVYVRQHTSETRFIDNKHSKFQHYQLQTFPRTPDAVLIGSSLTKNHISTEDFRSSGWIVYNMGISGRLLADFPSMAERALERNPRIIVLNISVADLLEAPHSDFIHFADLKAQWNAGLPAAALAGATGNFLLNHHLIHYYREPLYENILSALRRFAPAPAANLMGHEDRTPAYADQLRLSPDCDVFKRTSYENMVVLTCTNGDGVQLGRYNPELDPLPHKTESEVLNEGAVNLLREVVARINRSSRAVVVVQPTWEGAPDVNLELVSSRINAPLIDLRNATFTNGDWCDGGHFNLYGRKKYSALLETKLKPFLSGT